MTKKKKKTVKKIKEEDFDVEMTKDVAGSPQTTTKSMQASDAANAVTQAKQGDTEQYDQITVKRKKMGGPVKTTSRTTPQTSAKTQGMAGFGESKKTTRKKKTETKKRKTGVRSFKLTENYKNNRFDYPYSIMLPPAFSGLVKDIVEEVEDIKLSERYARLYIQIPNAETMDMFVESLVKKAKGKSKDSRAEIVISGIMGSVK